MKRLVIFSLTVLYYAQSTALAEQILDQNLPNLSTDGAATGDTKKEDFDKKALTYFQSESQQNFKNISSKDAMTDTANSYAKSYATGYAASKINSVLSPYGHVETSLAINDNGDMSGTSLDYLIPWYENESSVVFSQFDVHKDDNRTISNFGLGYRYGVTDNTMTGINFFYDYDMSRDHKRVGFGSEVWTNYLKFSGNYYLPVSSWKTSEDLDGYDERPARGWDIRIQGYLPSYPQFGTSVVYEKYYGNEVALFDTDNLQKNPQAVTVGFNYTPIPLLTFEGDYKKGTGDADDLSGTVALNYQIGVPFRKQLDSSEVDNMRTLKGDRLDFVDRNNDIILEYREKSKESVGLYLKPSSSTDSKCIIQDTPGMAQAYEGCKWTINALVSAHKRIKSASWVPESDFSPQVTFGLPSLSAESINEGDNNHWNLIFPAWNSVNNDANRYKLALTIEDENGNETKSNSVDIVVSESPRTYSLKITNAKKDDHVIEIPADGLAVADIETDGKKITGVNGETTNLQPSDINIKYHLYNVNDTKNTHEIEIKSSINDCGTSDSGCVFYVDKTTNGKASLASTSTGLYTVIGEDSTGMLTNKVLIDFGVTSKDFVTAITDNANPAVNLLGKNNKLLLNHTYSFHLAYDTNRNGVWDISDQSTVSDTDSTPLVSLVNYHWIFDGTSAHGQPGSAALPETDNKDLYLPQKNDDSKSIYANSGDDGIQGYDLKVDYSPTTLGKKFFKNM